MHTTIFNDLCRAKIRKIELSTANRRRRASRLDTDRSILIGTRVLLAEDDPTNQMVALGLLEAAGMRVEVAADGALAVEMARKGNHEIIWMDVQMPTLDGITATKMLRQEERFDELPIIAMTANAMNQHRADCLAAGMNDFVGKPYDPEQLYSVIQKWVTGSGDADLLASLYRTRMFSPDARLPGRIDGLDLRKGLRRVAGIKALYIATLTSFANEQGDIVERLQRSIADHELDRAMREAHTLKGAAAMIEAREISSLAASLESILATGQTEGSMVLVDRLGDELVPLLNAIHAAIDGSGERIQ